MKKFIMLILTSVITITSIASKNTWQFTGIKSAEITNDVSTLTNNLTLTIPKKITWQGMPVGIGIDAIIKRGDLVTVECGYDGILKNRFSGFVKQVNNKMPVTIICEDGMFLLKQKAIEKKGFKQTTIEQLMAFLLQGTNIKFNCIDKNIKLGNYRITKNNVAEELNEIKKEYGLHCYFRTIKNEQILYIGFAFPFDNVNKASFMHGKNIIAENFEYKNADDIKLKVTAISIDKKNNRIKEVAGDKDGEAITVYAYGLDKAALKTFAEASVKKYKYTGLKGSFTTFGEPLVTHADNAYIESEDGNKGTYLIKKVVTNFGTDGYRQVVDLGEIINLKS